MTDRMKNVGLTIDQWNVPKVFKQLACAHKLEERLHLRGLQSRRGVVVRQMHNLKLITMLMF